MAQSKIEETSGKMIENTTEKQHSNANTITETKTTDDEIKTNDNIKGDVILSLKCIPEYDQLPYNKQQQKFLFMASIKAPLFKQQDERSPIDLICVIDESGSMSSGNKIVLVKETVEFFIQNLTANDRLGLVGYGSDSRIILPLTKMDKNGKTKAFAANDQVQAIHAYDNLGAGLLRGVEMIRNRDIKNMNSVASIMMLADGHANKGMTTVEQIKKAISKGKKKELECTINTFGVGNDHDGTFLEKIATFGKGMYAYVQFNNQIGEIMAETLGGLISIIGQNLKVRIEALNNVRINKSLSMGFDTNIIKQNEIYQINIKDIQSEENRDLVFELNIPEISAEKNEYPIIKFSIEYLNVIKDKKDLFSIVSCIDRITGNDIGERNIELDIQHNRLVAAEAMDTANNLAKQNKFKDARLMITNAQKLINNSKSNKDDYVKLLVKDLEQCNNGLQSQSQYYAIGSKQLIMQAQAHYQQRSMQSQQLVSDQQGMQLQCAQQGYQNQMKFQMVQQQQLQQQQQQLLQQQQIQGFQGYPSPYGMQQGQRYMQQQQQQGYPSYAQPQQQQYDSASLKIQQMQQLQLMQKLQQQQMQAQLQQMQGQMQQIQGQQQQQIQGQRQGQVQQQMQGQIQWQQLQQQQQQIQGQVQQQMQGQQGQQLQQQQIQGQVQQQMQQQQQQQQQHEGNATKYIK